jgi:hypothetical protein
MSSPFYKATSRLRLQLILAEVRTQTITPRGDYTSPVGVKLEAQKMSMKMGAALQIRRCQSIDINPVRSPAMTA